MLVPVLLFIVGLLFLIKGGDWFVDGASALARRFHLGAHCDVAVLAQKGALHALEIVTGKLGLLSVAGLQVASCPLTVCPP